MADRLQLEVVTPRRRVLTAEADEVRLPGALGELGVLPGHTPLLTALGTGHLVARDGAREHLLVLQGGFAEVLPDRVTVLSDLAEEPGAIDAAAAEADRGEAETALKAASAEDLDALTARLRLAEARLAAVRR